MSIKITEIKSKYRPTFTSEAARLAYEEECRQKFDEDVKIKVEELKALYNADPKKYAKFKNFTEEDWTTYASNALKYYGASVNANYLDGTTPWSMKPENEEWSKFTYEEILAMEANGTLIPDEVLAWAHSMEENDVTSYELNDDGSQITEDNPMSEYNEMKANTLKLGTQSKTAEDTSKVKFEQMEELSKNAENIKKEQENAKKDSLKQIQDLTKEYDELSQKVKKGEQLDDGEKKRYQELGSLLNGKDGELVTDLQASSTELEDLMNSMDELNRDVKENVELGADTIDAATQLAWYETGYKDKNTLPNFFINVNVGDVRDMLYGAKGETVARDALDNGESLIDYSNTLGDQLMMNQYASLYEFATTFTTNASETINETKKVMGADFDKSSEEFEEEGELEGQETEESDEELNMDGLKKMGLGTRKLTAKDREVGQDSIKLAKEVIKEIKEINKKGTELESKKEEAVDEQANDAQSEVQEQNAEKSGNPEKAQEETEQPESIEDSTKTKAVNEEIEANNEKGLTIKERLDKSAKTNEKYGKFNNEAEDVMDLTGNMGTLSTLYGGVLIASGSQLIAAGTPLLPNIFTHPIGVALLVQGTLVLTAGAGFVGVGADLISIATEGVDATDITGEQIDLTDETIQKAMEAVENGGLIEEDQMSEAEGKRAEMIENGASLKEQAKFFKGESKKNGNQALGEILSIGAIKAESEKEGKAAELTAKVVELKTKKDKKEYDELKEKAEKSGANEEDKTTEEAIAAGADPEDIEDEKEKDENGFSEKDQKRMEELEEKLVSTGDKAQQKLYNSLTKIDGLEELLAGKDEIALNATDYGKVTQSIGIDLYNSTKGQLFLIYQMLLAVSTLEAGKFAQGMGNALQKGIETTKNVNERNRTRVTDAQSKVTEATMSEAQSPVSQELEGEESENIEGGEQNQEEEQNPEISTISAAPTAALQTTIAPTADAPTQSQQTPNAPSADAPAQSQVSQTPQAPAQRTPVQTTAGTMNPVAQTSGKLTGAAAIAAWSDPVGHINEIRAKHGVDPLEKKSDETQSTNSSKKDEEKDMQGQTEDLIADQAGNEKKGVDSQKEAKDADKDAKKEDKKSQSVKKDAEKSEKQLTKEGQNITKLIEQDQKKVEELTKDSTEAAQEQLALMAEFEVLNAQNDTIVANANQGGGAAAPAPSPMLSAQNDDNQQKGGGLLTGSVQQSGGMQDTSMAANQAQLESNNQRLVSISSRFTQLDVRINKNRVAMIKVQGSINKRVRKYEKVAKQKIALQKKAQKAEEAKQKKMQKTLAALDIVANVFSILGSIATLMEVCGTSMQVSGNTLIAVGTPLLSNPFTAAAGAVLCALGGVFLGLGTASEAGGISVQGICAIGVALMQVAKAAVLLANGYSMQALTTLATAAISIAASAVGAGGAADGVMAGISAGLNIVSSGTSLAANVQTLQGKEQSGWLNTVSQVAGAASAVSGVASGFSGGKDSAFSQANTFGKITQVVGATGTTLSTTAQISAMIKQANGEAPGKFENIMAMVGAGLSTASSLMSLGQAAFGGNKADGKGGDDTDDDKQVKNAKENDNKKADKKVEKEEKIEAKKAEKEQADKNKEKETLKDEVPVTALEVPETSADKAADLKETSNEALENIDNQNKLIDSETANEIKNYDPEAVQAEQQEQLQQNTQDERETEKVVKKEFDPVLSDEQKANIDAELQRRPKLEISKAEMPEKLEINTDYKNPAQQKFERQQKWQNAMKTVKNVGEGISQGAQLYSSISGIMGDNEKSEQNKNVLHLSNKEKGYALMRKINRRRKALAGYANRNY